MVGAFLCEIPTVSPEYLGFYAREARLQYDRGDLVAPQTLLSLVFRLYKDIVGTSIGFVSRCGRFYKSLEAPMRLLVEVWRRVGKAAEAEALEQDLDENEAILQGLFMANLDEYRAEQRAAAVAGRQPLQLEAPKKKKLTRK